MLISGTGIAFQKYVWDIHGSTKNKLTYCELTHQVALLTNTFVNDNNLVPENVKMYDGNKHNKYIEKKLDDYMMPTN